VLWALPAGGINVGVNHEIHHPRSVSGDDDCGHSDGVVAGPLAASCKRHKVETTGDILPSGYVARSAQQFIIRPESPQAMTLGFFTRGRVELRAWTPGLIGCEWSVPA